MYVPATLAIEPKKPTSDPIWIDRFAEALGREIPSMSAEEAVRRAEETYPDASDLAPEEAAAIYAAELPPADVGAPGD